MAGQMLGKNAKAYRNSATFGSPTWVEMSKISKLKGGLKWGRASNASRGSTVNRGGKTVGDLTFTFTVEQDLTDTTFLALWAALISPTAIIDLLILNAGSATDGARGFRGEMDLYSLDDDQAMENVLVYDIEAQPSATANALQTAVVGSGAPVFTTLAL